MSLGLAGWDYETPLDWRAPARPRGHRPSPAEGHSRRLRIIGMARIKPITSHDVAAHFGIDHGRAARRIQDLVREGKLKAVGVSSERATAGPYLKLYGVAESP